MLDTLCFITGPRTGANHLMRLGENFAELHTAPDLFQSFGDRLEPEAALERVTAAALAEHKRVLAFKLWPDMFDAEMVEEIILSRPGVRLVFVVRRQIDAYVSWCKAIEAGAWQEADTTALQLRLDIDDFTAWMAVQEIWYEHWRHWLDRHGLPCPILRYESDIDQPPVGALRRFAAAAAQVGVTMKVPAEIRSAGLIRQDQGKSAAGKAVNWPEFSRALGARGLERRAFGYPA